MDLREQLRVQETKALKLGEEQFKQRIASAETSLEAARGAGESTAIEKATRELEEAKLEHELFIWEHDTTGALKGDRFGSSLREALEQDLGAQKNEKGELVCEGDAALTQVVYVNMGELDRLNASGDHALGDKALNEANVNIQEVIEQMFADVPESGRPKIDTFRIASNDFGLILKGATAEQAAELSKRLSKPLDVSKFHKGEDPVPLAASAVSFESAVAVYNRLPRRPEMLGPEADTTMTDVVGVLKEQAQSLNDFEKNRSRVTRMVDLLQAAGEGEAKRVKARLIYENFLKKSLGNLFAPDSQTQPMDFEGFNSYLHRQGAFEPESQMSWQADVFDASRKDTLKQLNQRLSTQRAEAKGVSEFVLEAFEQKAVQERLASRLHSLELNDAPASSHLREAPAVRDQGEIDAFTGKVDALGKTEGEERIAQLMQQLEQLPPTAPERKKAQLTLDLEKAKRDSLTGLYGRGMYYISLEERLNKSEPTSVIAIDMAFLKYFDRDGGKATGDRAIKTAARIMEAAKRKIREKHGEKFFAEAYRTGGDEFAFTLGTADPAIVEDVQRIVNSLSSDIGELPYDDGGTGHYEPTELQFNFGACNTVDEAHSEEHGPDSTPRESADRITHRADAGIESDKAINRLSFLFQKQVALQAWGGSPENLTRRQRHVQDLTVRSEKAIFDGTGSQKIQEWTQAFVSKQKTFDQVEDEIVEFVKVELRAKKNAEVRFMQEMHTELSHDIEVSLLEREVGELADQVTESHLRFGVLREQYRSLQEEVRNLREDKSQMTEIRGKIKDFRDGI